MTMTHTPAPWHFNGRRITTGAFIVADIWNADEPTGQANVALIAAAPAMVDTLLWIHEHLHPRVLGRAATDAELIAISLATKVLREAGVIPTPELEDA